MKPRSRTAGNTLCCKKRVLGVILLALFTSAISLVPGTAYASSFQILEQSPARLGTGFSGSGSDVRDATTMFFNPAGMSQLDGLNFTAGGNLIAVQSEFEDAGSNTGGVVDETDEVGFVPNLYYTYPINNQWTFGLGLSAPFGLKTEYDKNWIGRYLATDSELTLVNVNPAIAYEVNEQLSLGFGLDYQDIDVELENQVDSTLGVAPDPSRDSSAKVEGDDEDVTVDLSLHWQPTNSTKFGVLWRQGGDFTVDGTASFDKSTTFCQPGTGFVIAPGTTTGDVCFSQLTAREGDVSADVELPDVLNLSGSHKLSGYWTVHADVAWTEWSSIQSVRIVNDNGTLVDELVLDYDDTIRYSFGATYDPEGPWIWRFGIFIDEAPQTDPSKVTPRIPDEDRVAPSIGFHYAFSKNASLDFGYSHVFAEDTQINSVDSSTGNTVRGEFDNSADVLGIQGNWIF